MYRSLLVPLDGSQFGEHALPLARAIARQTSATLHLVHVHVIRVPISVDAIPVFDEALDAHANLNVSLPAGPSHYVYSDEGAFRIAMERAGFRPESMALKLHTIEWIVPSVDFVFEAERFAGVRTAGLLAKQSPAALEKIRQAIAVGLKPYARGDGYAIPKAAYVVAVTKS